MNCTASAASSAPTRRGCGLVTASPASLWLQKMPRRRLAVVHDLAPSEHRELSACRRTTMVAPTYSAERAERARKVSGWAVSGCAAEAPPAASAASRASHSGITGGTGSPSNQPAA